MFSSPYSFSFHMKSDEFSSNFVIKLYHLYELLSYRYSFHNKKKFLNFQLHIATKSSFMSFFLFNEIFKKKIIFALNIRDFSKFWTNNFYSYSFKDDGIFPNYPLTYFLYIKTIHKNILMKT